ncbi:TetR/AcrR family transcriptional regulator [Nakamurella antarctica]|nr:TetR/AcrR family transcriptional regulator [Nakamurella antarctica]
MIELGRNQLVQAAVVQINLAGVESATIAKVCTGAGLDEADFTDFFADRRGLLLHIGASLAHMEDAAVRATLSRRRSLTETVRLALLALWATVEEHPELQQAAHELTFSGMRHGEPISVAQAQHEAYCACVQQILEAIAQSHGIKWERPVTELTHLVVSTVDGLKLGYLVSKDSTAARQVLELFAYHVAQHGRRTAKNDPK